MSSLWLFLLFFFAALKATETVTPRARFLGTRTLTSSSLEEAEEVDEVELSLFLFLTGDGLDASFRGVGAAAEPSGEGAELGERGRAAGAREPSRSRMDLLQL